MYQIKCDGNVLYDPRDEDLIVQNPRCKLKVNTVGEASFTIFANHPHYGKLQKLKSIFEILQDNETIFRGRMTEDSNDFNNTKAIDLEGAMAYFNDSTVRPFKYPEDFMSDSGYLAAVRSGNVVEYFLKWLIEQHNARVKDFQKFKLGTVTVSDPNNYITRSSEDYASTWETLKDKLFDSALGGYLCIRYEPDGNYIDYLSDFDKINAQRIEYGENLLDLSTETNASETYSAIIPLGKKKNEINEKSTDKSRLTVADLPDGDLTDDLVKVGDTIYSKSAVEQHGWIEAPTVETTWDDVTDVRNLRSKGVEFMEQTATKVINTITVTAVDLHYSDAEIEAFRIYRYVYFESRPHSLADLFRLGELDLDLFNPQNTKITVGEEERSLIDANAKKVSSASQQLAGAISDVSNVTGQIAGQTGAIVSQCNTYTDTALQDYVPATEYVVLKNSVSAEVLTGKEYRTAEKHLGKPVYTKVVDCGLFVAGSSVNVAVDIVKDGNPVIRFSCYSGTMPLPYICGSINSPESMWVAINHAGVLTMYGADSGAQTYCQIWYTRPAAEDNTVPEGGTNPEGGSGSESGEGVT